MSKWQFVVILAGLSLVGCKCLERAKPREHEESVPLSEVPAKVKEAAKAAVKGIVFTEAELEHEDGRVVYELEGEADGKKYEIEVTPDGKVIEVEEDDGDD